MPSLQPGQTQNLPEIHQTCSINLTKSCRLYLGESQLRLCKGFFPILGLDTDICVQLDKNNSVDTLVALQPTKLSVIIEGARAGSGQPIQAEAEAVAVCHTHAQANQDLQQRLQGLQKQLYQLQQRLLLGLSSRAERGLNFELVQHHVGHQKLLCFVYIVGPCSHRSSLLIDDGSGSSQLAYYHYQLQPNDTFTYFGV